MKLLHSDCLEALKSFADSSIDSVVCDPPYGIDFMGKEWDSFGRSREYEAREGYGDKGILPGYGRGGTSEQRESYRRKSNLAFQEWAEAWARELLRVLKPGGHLLAFSGTRTYHRMACAIEDAGFEIRDQIGWAYGSGFPKSHDVSKAIDKAAGAEREVLAERANRSTFDLEAQGGGGFTRGTIQESAPATPEAAQWQGWGTALKPAWEPICVARKPLIGTVAENVLTHGTGALNIDGCRVEHVTVEGGNLALNPHLRKSINGGNGGNIFPTEEERRVVTPNALGRWPANLIHDGSDEVLAAFPESKGAQGAVKGTEKPKVGTNTFGDYGQRPLQDIRGDSGSAARFFYCAKTSKKERNQGCNDLIQWENLDLNHENQFLISLLKDISEDTTLILKDIEWNTILFGKKQMDKSQTDMMFIIKMVSKQIIALKTSNFSQNSIIKDYILDVIKQSMERGLNLVEIVENIKQLKQNIIDEKMGLVLGAVIAVSEMLLRIKDKGKVGNFHATVKPIALMAYLCRLVTPPNGTVLDPFMGSGSTGIAAQKEGFDFIGIEREENYFKIARKRIAENKKDDLSEIL